METVNLADTAAAPAFTEEVKERSGVDINRCYQCLTCSLSCPTAYAMDFFPNQLIRLAQLGSRQEVLRSSTIWLCASCETCVTRCPNEIDIPRLMDTMRQMAVRENITGSEKAAPVLNRIFLNGVKRWGRPYELGMLIELKLRLRDFFSDLDMGVKMLLKGKLSMLPGKIKGSQEMRNIFKKSEELNK